MFDNNTCYIHVTLHQWNTGTEGANVDLQINTGEAVLMMASATGNTEIVKLLIDEAMPRL